MDRAAIHKIIIETRQHLSGATPERRQKIYEKLLRLQQKLKLAEKAEADRQLLESNQDFLEEC